MYKYKRCFISICANVANIPTTVAYAMPGALQAQFLAELWLFSSPSMA
jgi:hypothetical protein